MTVDIYKAIYHDGGEYFFICDTYQNAHIHVKQIEEKKVDGKRDFYISLAMSNVTVTPK